MNGPGGHESFEAAAVQDGSMDCRSPVDSRISGEQRADRPGRGSSTCADVPCSWASRPASAVLLPPSRRHSPTAGPPRRSSRPPGRRAPTPAGRLHTTARSVSRRGRHGRQGGLPLRRAGRPLHTRVWYPNGPGRYPLVVFGHGLHAQPDDYVALLVSWALAGFVVAAPLYPHTSLGTATFNATTSPTSRPTPPPCCPPSWPARSAPAWTRRGWPPPATRPAA